MDSIKRVALFGHGADINQAIDFVKHMSSTSRSYSPELIKKMFEWAPSFVGTEFNYPIISSKDYDIHAFHTTIPFIPEMRLSLKQKLTKVEQGFELAVKENADIVALGAFTSIACCGREEYLKSKYGISMTSGNTLTAAITITQIKKACSLLYKNLEDSTVAVIGASGDIGSGCVIALCDSAKKIILSARGMSRLKKVAEKASQSTTSEIEIITDTKIAIKKADIVISTAASDEILVHLEDIKPGAIICDIGYPKNIPSNTSQRKDILVFDGGLAILPKELDFGYDMKLPRNDILFGCFTEGLLLAAEGYTDLFSHGRGNITVEKMNYILDIAMKYDIKPAPFFSNNRVITENEIEIIKENSKR